MGRGTLGTSRGIAAATSLKGYLTAEYRTQKTVIAQAVNEMQPPADGSWVGAANNDQQARVRLTSEGYEVQLFTSESDNPQIGFYDATKEGLRTARRVMRRHLGV